MKKYLLKYFNPNTNKWVYAKNVDENGCTYILVPQQENAERFYGKNAIKNIERRVKLDEKKWYGYSEHTVEEIEENPQGRFELEYAISHYDNFFGNIKKGFFKFMTETDSQKVTTIHDLQNLGVDMLERYYYWRKENYKGKPKQY